MKEKAYVEAYVHYSEASSQTKDKEYLLKFTLNKAIVCFKLNLIEEYGSNIEKVLSK